MVAWRFFTRRRLASRKAARSMSARSGSTSRAGSQKTPWMGPSASHAASWVRSSSVGVAGSSFRALMPLRPRVAPRAWPTPPSSWTRRTRAPRPRWTPVGLQSSRGGRREGTGTRRGIVSASSSVARAGTDGVTAGAGAAPVVGAAEGAGGGIAPGAMASEGAPGTGARSGRKSYTNWTTCWRVGKSRSCMFSWRSIPYSSRTAAKVSACFTVSTPRSASRSRSISSMSEG